MLQGSVVVHVLRPRAQGSLRGQAAHGRSWARDELLIALRRFTRARG